VHSTISFDLICINFYANSLFLYCICIYVTSLLLFYVWCAFVSSLNKDCSLLISCSSAIKHHRNRSWRDDVEMEWPHDATTEGPHRRLHTLIAVDERVTVYVWLYNCAHARPRMQRNKVGVTLDKGLHTCYSAMCTYMSQTCDQQRFAVYISEVAADWHEPMVPQLSSGWLGLLCGTSNTRRAAVFCTRCRRRTV